MLDVMLELSSNFQAATVMKMLGFPIFVYVFSRGLAKLIETKENQKDPKELGPMGHFD